MNLNIVIRRKLSQLKMDKISQREIRVMKDRLSNRKKLEEDFELLLNFFNGY